MSTIATDTRNNEDAYAALASGRYGDPFGVLGIHQVGGSRIVRTLQPHAERVEIIDNQGTVLGEMERVHPDGIFAALMPPRLRHYRLRVTTTAVTRWISRIRIAFRRRWGTSTCTCSEKARTSRSTPSSARSCARYWASAGHASPSGHRMPRGSVSSATSTTGTAAVTSCACTPPTGSGRSSYRASAAARNTSSNCSTATAACCR